jgi:GNAT superfamily N-acetyltransferase
MDYAIVVASASDAPTIAALHAESWRTAYRGLYRDEFLDGPVFDERLWFWNERMAAPHPERRRVLLATVAGEGVGFACVLLDDDPAWSPLLDNLHVKLAYKGQGIGARLLTASREWIADVAPGQPMHLWVMEGNTAARRFYDRQGGRVAERSTVEYGPGSGQVVLRYIWDPLRTPNSSLLTSNI